MELISLLWNGLVFDPMLNGLVLLYAVTGRNFGITIILFTILIRLVTLPLALRQIRSTKKMSEVQPKIQALQKRYAKDKARLSQETMRLYKEMGVNPIGCLGPMVIQFPIWIGLYYAIVKVLPTNPESLASLSSHLYSWIPVVHEVVPLNSRFLGLDLSTAGVPPLNYVVAFLVGGSMWVMQKMSTPLSADPRQRSTNQMMLWMMPFMFGFFTITLPSGLPLYWFVSNLIGIVIQYFVTGWAGLIPSRTKPAPVAAGVDAGQSSPDSIQDEETVNDGKQSRDERQERRGSHRARPKGARRRTRGSRHRGG
ncbi:MAG: YidC/Oxa1 family membrane protein insertase [Dehalococcoidia bacterium]|nr:YidC/Oxa1 family membrane protein insertase [Dehalococcoidia bacterium]